ncbi:acyl-homoserine-lactone synthase [Hirschia baltica]|uniref:Acyl-homoserine-lactone synthase n=1 Tax=Hirschia baltica (strain ATCC 49814 / DSM 5838 / IFAM 1418) TaxID=582402 RepID=C6XK66_HIRBI|nr:acyl-homoserine-lactone synthase [Hirschia baltica]ACT59511.1 N-acyl-L-homoserine lactone synthetase-like protein [Hirschia baltica ATCC 49814]
MIHVVTGENQHLYGPQLDEMFRMRHEYFVQAKGWDALQSINGKETDEFDDGDVVYLINLDFDGRVASAYRLNSSTGPNLLADKLSNFVDGELPKREEVWDLTRWIMATRYRRSKDFSKAIQIARETIIGVHEFAVSRGISHLTTVCDPSFVERMARVDMHYSPLGPPVEFDEGKGIAQALLLETGPTALARARAATGITQKQLFEVQPKPFYLSPDQIENEAAQELAAAKMKLMSKVNAQKIVQSLADEMAQRAIANPAGAIALIHSFNEILQSRLHEHSISDFQSIETLQMQANNDAPATDLSQKAS